MGKGYLPFGSGIRAGQGFGSGFRVKPGRGPGEVRGYIGPGGEFMQGYPGFYRAGSNFTWLMGVDLVFLLNFLE